MNQMQTAHLFGLVVGTTVMVSAFHLPNIALQHHSTPLTFVMKKSVQILMNTYVSTRNMPIIEDSSHKVIKSCKQLQAVSNDSINTSSIILHNLEDLARENSPFSMVFRHGRHEMCIAYP